MTNEQFERNMKIITTTVELSILLYDLNKALKEIKKK